MCGVRGVRGVRVSAQVCPISSASSAGPFEPDQKQQNWALNAQVQLAGSDGRREK